MPGVFGAFQTPKDDAGQSAKTRCPKYDELRLTVSFRCLNLYLEPPAWSVWMLERVPLLLTMTIMVMMLLLVVVVEKILPPEEHYKRGSRSGNQNARAIGLWTLKSVSSGFAVPMGCHNEWSKEDGHPSWNHCKSPNHHGHGSSRLCPACAMGNVSCSKIIRAAGCSDLAVILKGLGRDAGGGDDDEDSDSQAQTFREEMRRRAGLRSLEDSRQEEVEMKRHAVLERVRKNPRQRKGDPLELLRPEASLHDRVVVAMSTSLEPQDTAFDVKSVHVVGLPSLESIGDEHFASIRSERARLPSWQRPNQDEAFFVELKDGYRVCAVADGHGAEGHRAAAAVRDFLLRRLVASLPATRSSNVDEHRIRIHSMLLKALEDANHALFSGEEAVDARASGATACVVVYDMKRRWLFTSWVGDCRCVVGEYVEEGGALTEGGRRTSIGSEGHSSEGNSSKRRRGRGLNKTTVSGVRLSEDHTLSDANERVRIAQFSATIANGPLGLDEVYLSGHKFPGVHCSRCLGNLVAKQLGITAQPEDVPFMQGRCVFW
eukprot:s849_g9.t3